LTPTKILQGNELQDKLGTTLGATIGNELGVSQTGYAAGATALTYDATTNPIPVGTLITVGTSAARYLVTAATATVVTIAAPGLLAAVVDNAVINVIGRTGQLKIGDGNLTYSEKRTREYLLDRGIIDEVRDGDEAPLEITMGGTIEYFTGHSTDPNGAPPSINDMLHKSGLASTWISSDTADACRPYSVDIEIDHRPDCTIYYAELIRFPGFRFDNIDGDLKAASFSVAGKCNIRQPEFIRYDLTP
jgi:hypothetical protein